MRRRGMGAAWSRSMATRKTKNGDDGAGGTRRPAFTLRQAQRALSLDSTTAVLGYLPHLPGVGETLAGRADVERKLLADLHATMGALRRLRAGAHEMAAANWTENEIDAANAAQFERPIS